MPNGAPIYKQIASELRSSIADKQLQPGDRLPTLRHLADKWGVARETVAKAYRDLADEGLIVTLPGRGGTVVANKEEATTIAVALQSIQPLKIESIQVAVADTNVAESLGIASGTSILLIKIRTSNLTA